MRRSSRGPERTLQQIQRAFASATSREEFERAEGWLAVARWVEGHRYDVPSMSRPLTRKP